MGKDKKSNNISPKWKIANVFIQAIIGVGIIAAFFSTISNLREQKKFNRYTLRPFISYVIQRNLKVTENFIKVTNAIGNSGRTPAYNVKIYSIFTTSNVFPIDYLKKIVNTDTTFYGVLIPKDQKINKEIISQLYNQNGQSLNMKKIKTNLSKESVFYHIYIVYEDLSGNKYYLRSTSKNFLPYGLVQDIYGYECDWYIIDASEESL